MKAPTWNIASRPNWLLAVALCGTLGSVPLAQNAEPWTAAAANEAAFLRANDVAMKTMMATMSVRPSGNVDRDFVAMMEPHHQGAIDMAQALLRYGTNEQLKRLAQEIIVTQQQKIAAMRLAIGEPLPAAGPAPTQTARESGTRL